MTVKADDDTKTFTGSTISVTVGASAVPGGLGIVSGHTVNAVASGSGIQPGDYDITIQSVKIMNGSVDVSNNYTITQQKGTLKIGKIVLTVQVANAIKNQGAPDPLRYSTALRGGTLMSGDTLGTIGLVFERDPGETPGTYQIRVTLASDKYEVVCIPGILTIRSTGAVTR